MSDFERQGPPPTDRTAVFLQLGLGVVSTFVLHAFVGGALYAVAAIGSFAMSGLDFYGGWGWTVLSLVTSLPMFWLFTVGLSQLLYVGPAALAAFFVRKPLAFGLLIGAALTFMFQSACYGLAAVLILPALGGLH